MLHLGRAFEGNGEYPIHTDRTSRSCEFNLIREIVVLYADPHVLFQINLPISDTNPSFLNLDDKRRQLLALPTADDSTFRPIPVKACLDMGISSYYTTPLSLEDLANAILPALESRQLPTGDGGESPILHILLAEVCLRGDIYLLLGHS